MAAQTLRKEGIHQMAQAVLTLLNWLGTLAWPEKLRLADLTIFARAIL
jgi:hypothetical protein